MLDVIYYLLEEDAVPHSGDQAEARAQFRTRMYPVLWEREYKFAPTRQRSFDVNDPSGGGTGTSIIPDDVDGGLPAPRPLVSKPYIPPTDGEIGPNWQEPFKGLDSPLV